MKQCSSSCELDCSGAGSCQGLEARCSADSSCSATCSNGHTCAYNFHSTEKPKSKFFGHWNLNCTGAFSCSGIDGQLSQGALHCGGSFSCRSMNMHCKEGEFCQAYCTKVFSCQKDPSSNFPSVFTGHWNLDCTKYGTCQNIEATCAIGKTCTATCSGYQACKGAKFVGNWIRKN